MTGPLWHFLFVKMYPPALFFCFFFNLTQFLSIPYPQIKKLDSGKLNNFPKVTQLVDGISRIATQGERKRARSLENSQGGVGYTPIPAVTFPRMG